VLDTPPDSREQRSASATSAPVGAPPENVGLLNAIGVLRSRWWVIAISVVVCVLASLVLTLRATKQYTATAKLLFTQNSLIPEVGGSSPAPSQNPQADQATNLQVVTTRPVGAAVKKSLGLSMSVSDLLGEVTTTDDAGSNIVDVNATDPSPTRAARIANEFARQFVALSQADNLGQVLAGERLLNDKLKALAPTDVADRANLEAALRKLLILQAVQTGDAQVVDQASVPTSPSYPNKKLNVLIALVFGLALGVGLAFLMNLLDRRLKTVEEIEELYGTRALAEIPRLALRKARAVDPAQVEQFLILRAGLSVLNPTRETRVLLVTSAVPGEGKTTVAIGLAQAVASSGHSVVLLEADVKRPAFASRLGLPGHLTGLTTALVEGVPIDSLMHAPVAGTPSLLVIPSGPPEPNSATLLRGQEMGRILEQLTSTADLVVIDAPPLLPVADAQALLEHPELDAVLVVGRVEYTKRDEARRAHHLLERRGVRDIGLVVNGVRDIAGGTYYGRRAA
jgi:capsular exopolysaccharide synthesis family protein